MDSSMLGKGGKGEKKPEVVKIKGQLFDPPEEGGEDQSEFSQMQSGLITFPEKKGGKMDGFDEENYAVYPLSVSYSAKERCLMRCQRIFCLLLIIIIVIPYDIWYQNPYFRWYWASKVTNLSMPTSVSKIDMQIQGCSILLKSHSTNLISFKVYSQYSTNPKVAGNVVTVQGGDKKESFAIQCRIEMSMPTTVTLPELSITTTGQSNPKIKIYEDMPAGAFFNFGGNKVSVTGDLMNVYLYRAHQLGILDMNLQRGHIQVSNIVPSTSVSLIVNAGTIDFGEDKEVVTITKVVESNGQVCVKGADVSTLTSTNCPSATVRKSLIPWNNGTVDTSAQCTVVGSLCKSSPCSGSPAYSLTAQSNDGAVQVTTSGSNTFSTLRTHVEMDVASQTIMKDFASMVTANEEEDYMIIMDVFLPGYTGVWMYSTARAYLIGVPWALSAVSGGLLKPKTTRVKLYMADSVCPTRTKESKDFLNAVATEIQTYVPDKASTLLVNHKTQDKYYTYRIDEEGRAEEIEVHIQYIDWAFIAAYAISGFIAVYGALQLMVLLFKLFKVANVQYTDYIDKQRHFALIKKFHDSIKVDDSKKGKKKKEGGPPKKAKRFNLGLFTSSLTEYDPPTTKKKTEAKQDLSRYGFFTIISILYEKQRRKQMNSLQEFLELVPTSSVHFPKNRYQENSPQYNTTLNFYNFDDRYQEFCIKYGYEPLLLDEAKSTLESFNIQLVLKMDKETLAYTKIRWKRDNEKKDSVAVDSDQMSADNPASVFLKMECVPSNFESDHIFASELESKFQKYCKVQGVPAYKVEKIVGSPEMEKFGAIRDDNFAIRVLQNVTDIGKKAGAPKPSADDFDLTFVRAQVSTQNKEQGKMKKLVGKVKAKFRVLLAKVWGVDGPLTCLTQVIVNYAAILVVVVPMYIIVHFIYGEKSRFSSDVYSTYFDIENIVQPDRSNYYPNVFSAYGAAIGISIYCVVVYIVALMELISYFAVGFLNTGRYPVKRSFLKNLLTITFWIFFFLNLYLYAVYVICFLVWFILGAIINPNLFLPYAAASVTFIGFVYVNKNRLQKFYEEMIDQLAEIIKKKMMFFLKKTLEQLAGAGSETEISKKLVGEVANAGKEMFVKQILSVMGKDIKELDPDLVERLIQGQQEAFEELVSLSIGMHEGLTKAIFAIQKKDKEGILEAVKLVAEELKIDPELTEAFAGVFLSSVANELQGVPPFVGQTLKAIKKLVRQLFPDVESELIDAIIPLLTEGKFMALKSMLTSLNKSGEDSDEENEGGEKEAIKLPLALFQGIGDFVQGDEEGLLQRLRELIEDLFSDDSEAGKFKPMFLMLFDILRISPYYGIESLINLAGVEEGRFIVSMAGALAFDDENFTRECIGDVGQEMVALCAGNQEDQDPQFEGGEETKKGDKDPDAEDKEDEKTEDSDDDGDEAEREKAKFTNLLQGMINIFKLTRVNVDKIISYDKENDLQGLKVISGATNGSVKDFKQLLDRMKVQSNIDAVIDLYNYFLLNDLTFSGFKKMLNLSGKDDKLIISFIKLFAIGLDVNSIFKDEETKLEEDEEAQLKSDFKEVMKFFVKRGFVTQGKAMPGLADKSPEEVAKELFVNHISKGDVTPINTMINVTLVEKYDQQFVDLLRSLAIISYDFNSKSKRDKKPKIYTKSLDILCTKLDMDDDDMVFILDICKADPQYVFRTIPKEESQPWWEEFNFDKDRVKFVADILQVPEHAVKNSASYWIGDYKTIEKGNKRIHDLAHDVILVPEQFLYFLQQKNAELNDHGEKNAFLQIEAIADVIREVFDRQSSIVPNKNNPLTKILDEKFPIGASLRPENFSSLEATEEQQQQLMTFVSYIFDFFADLFVLTGWTFDELELDGAERLFALLQVFLQQQRSADFLPLVAETARFLFKESKVNAKMIGPSPKKQFMDLAILFSTKSLNNDRNKSDLNEAIKLVISNGAEAVEGEEEDAAFQMMRYKNSHFLKVLFEDGFFDGICDSVFKSPVQNLLKGKVTVQKPNCILGAFIGLAMKDNSLMIISLSEFLNEVLPHKLTLGILGLVFNDLTYEKEINILAQKGGVSSKLLVAAMDILSSKPQRIGSDIETLQHNTYENIERTSAYVNLFKKQLTQLGLISQELKVNQQLLKAVFSLAVNKQEDAEPYYGKLVEKLRLSDVSALNTIVKVVSGQDLQGLRMDDLDTVNAFLYFTAEGRERCDPTKGGSKENADPSQLTYHLRVLLRKLKKCMVTQFNHTYVVEKKKIKLDIQSFLRLLTQSIWGNDRCLKLLATKYIPAKIKDAKSIWQDARFLERREEVLFAKLKEFFLSMREEQSKLHQQRQQVMQKYMNEVEEQVEEIVNKVEEQVDVEEGGGGAADELREFGCSIQYSGIERMRQSAYICLTCQEKSGKPNQICQVCAYVCHAEHVVERHNFGCKTEMLCECKKVPKDPKTPLCEFKTEPLPPLPEVEESEEGKKKDDKQENPADKQFKKALTKYTLQQFISDLEKVFPLPKPVITSKYLKKTGMQVRDYEENRFVSFMDNWILLVSGQMRPSFMTLFMGNSDYTKKTNEEANHYNHFQKRSMKEYKLAAGIVSLAQGNHTYFALYGQSFVDQLKIMGSREVKALDIVYSLYTLVNGLNVEKDDGKQEGDLLYDPVKSYDHMFQQLFGEQASKVKGLHKLLTADKEILLAALKTDKGSDEGGSGLQKEVKDLFQEMFFSKIANREQAVYEKFKKLVRFSLGDTVAIQPCQFDYEKIISDATRNSVPKEMIQVLLKAGKRQPLAVVEAMVTKYAYITSKKGSMFKKKKLGDEMKKDHFIKCKNYLTSVMEVINGLSLNVEESIDNIFESMSIDKKHKKGLSFLQGVLQQNIGDVMTLWPEDLEKEQKNKIKTVLTVMMSQWEKKDIAKLVEIIPKLGAWEQFIPEGGIEHRWLTHEKTIDQLSDLFDGLQGNLVRLGQFLDAVVYQNQSCTYTLLTTMFTGSPWKDQMARCNPAEFKQLVSREIYKISVQLLGQAKELRNDQPQDEFEGGEKDKTPGSAGLRKSGTLKRSATIKGGKDEESKGEEFKDEEPVESEEAVVAISEDKLTGLFSTLEGKRIPEMLMMTLTLNTQMLHSIYQPEQLFEGVKCAGPLFEFIKSGVKTKGIQGLISCIDGLEENAQIKIPNFPNMLNIDLKEVEDLFKKAKIDYEEEIPLALRNALNYKVTDDGIELDLIKAIELILGSEITELNILLTIAKVFQPLFQDIPMLPQVLKAFSLLVEGRKGELLVFIPQLLLMAICSLKLAKMAKRGKKAEKVDGKLQILGKKESHFAKALIKFINVILITDHEDDKLQIILEEMLEYVADYAEETGSKKSFLLQNKDKIPMVSTCISGVIFLSQGELWKIGKMAAMLGDFDEEKFQSLTNKILKFTQVFAQESGGVDKEKAKGAVQSMMSGLVGDAFDASELFRLFDKDGNGMIEFSEFADMDKYLGFNLGEQKMLQLFSKADKDQDSFINYDEFVHANLLLRYHVAIAALEKTGLSLVDLVYFFVQAVILLLLMLCFIFVGIVAMSSGGGFQSIVNSAMPLAAGLGASSKKLNVDDAIKKLKDVVDKVLASMKNAI